MKKQFLKNFLVLFFMKIEKNTIKINKEIFIKYSHQLT